jgi:hypothetical protein
MAGLSATADVPAGLLAPKMAADRRGRPTRPRLYWLKGCDRDQRAILVMLLEATEFLQHVEKLLGIEQFREHPQCAGVIGNLAPQSLFG